jgi:hypothetical protein
VNAEAKVNLGFCFHEGVGVAQNHLKSAQYFKEAANAGNAIGQFNYGLCCYRGEGALYDFREASEHFRMSQEQGYVPAIQAFIVCLRDSRIPSQGLRDIIFYGIRLSDMTALEGGVWNRIWRIEAPTEMKGLDQGNLMRLGDSVISHTLNVKTLKRCAGWSQLDPKLFVKHRLSKLKVDLSGFKEVKILDWGSFGIVKLMKNLRGDELAVKLIPQKSSVPADILSQSFKREFDALFNLSHPCVVPLLGFARCQEGSVYALVMKHMENGSLRDVLMDVKAGKVPTFWTGTGIAIIVCGVACGLEFIHSAGFVHRDVKPANLLIDERGRCLVGDFGSSKFIAEKHRWTGDVVGTFLYAASELYDQPPYSTKIDVFAFGLILYEILVGRMVFPPTLAEKQIMDRARDGTRAAFPDWLDQTVQRLISRCWAVNPSERPSFAEILNILELIQFKILPDVDSSSVAAFLSDVRCDIDRNSRKSA